MLLYFDDIFAGHDTGSHPECAARIQGVNRMLREKNWPNRATCPTITPASLEQIAAVHSSAYIEQLEAWCAADAGKIEADTVVSSGSWQAILHASGAAIDAVHRVVRGEGKRAFCALRPPGHHALPSGAMGFCLFNQIAVAAKAALSAGLDRVMIVDWDVHHGNGTQDVFYEDERISFYSIHRYPFYPGTGAASETGTNAGLGSTFNEPVAKDIEWPEFKDKFTRGIEALASRNKPDLILLSAGFDAHPKDPVGGLCVQENDFAELTEIVKQLAGAVCDGKIVSLLEGGYHVDLLPKCVQSHIDALAESTTS